jgi:hypothetical protein
VPPFIKPEPRVAVPSLNNTMPVGVPPNGAETNALKVIAVPNALWLEDDVSLVVVGALLTACKAVGSDEEAKFRLPL